MLCPHPIAATFSTSCPLCELESAAPAVEPPRPTLGDVRRRVRAEIRRRCRLSFAEFVKRGWPALHGNETLAWNWHHDVICEYAQKLGEDLIRARRDRRYRMRARNVIFNVPPRSLKTEILGIYFPVWLWLHDPALKIRYMSGNERVRSHASRASRDLIDSVWFKDTFQPTWTIRHDIDAVGLYANTARGERKSSTYGQSIVGEGTDVIINDDPIDAADAYSEVQREAVITKWDESIHNRVNDPKRCLRIGIMQRLHEADWTGHVLAKGVGWRHVSIAMEYEKSRNAEGKPSGCACSDCFAPDRDYRVSVFGRYDKRKREGELLHEDRFPAEIVAEEKTRLGSYGSAGQLQQRPAPLEGGMFKRAHWGWFDPVDLPRLNRVIVSVDCSMKKTPGGSRTSMLVVAEAGPSRYILDNITRPMDILDMRASIETLLKRYPEVQTVLIEDKAAGTPLITELQQHISCIVPFDPKGDDKASRAMSAQPYVEGRNVLLPKGAAWTDDFVHELATFPNGTHDDQVDAFSQAINFMRGETLWGVRASASDRAAVR